MNLHTPIRILIADDHWVVRDGLATLISRCPDMEVIAEADDGRQALECFRCCRPDVTLMDLRMPRLGGADAIAAICAEFPRARVLALTTFDSDEYIYRVLRAGARGFLLKDAPREELLDVIRAVHAGRTHIPPGIAAKLAARMNCRELTSREHEVLEHITAGRSNLEIATALFVTESTVKSHVNSILSKLRVTDRTQAVTTAVKRGLVTLD